ncbi:MAG: colanic acid/amylovoran biosynthesis glycosyltransferase [Crocinitomicaceae bacterium]
MAKLAIISTNRAKYSETFIRMHIDELPFEIVLYSDGHFPEAVSLDKGASFTALKSKKKWWQSTDPENSLIQSFKENKIDFVLAEYGPAGTEVMNVCSKLKLPLIVHFHGYDGYRDDVLNSHGKRYAQLFDIATAVIGVSKDMCTQLTSLGCPKDKLHHVPYGIDVEIFKPGSESQQNYFISCGRFVAKKAPLNTLKAFLEVVRVKNFAHLIMIGNGELLDSAKEFVQANGLDTNVTFKGVLTQNEIVILYHSARAFVQHSIKTVDNDSEGTPLAVLEASASGLPIIATRHAGIIDSVDENITGLLTDEGDLEGMTASMLRILESKEEAKLMGENGRKKVLNEYTSRHYLDRLTQILVDSKRKQ